MNDKPSRMDYRQHQAARRLVHECCNYDEGNCLLLDDGESLSNPHKSRLFSWVSKGMRYIYPFPPEMPS